MAKLTREQVVTIEVLHQRGQSQSRVRESSASPRRRSDTISVASGKVRPVVTIKGTNLSRATKVTFKEVKAR